MDPVKEVADCPACRAIDRADGVEDGKLYRTVAKHVKHEGVVARGLRKAQDKAADAITSFAGSMTFIYLHTGWFGIWLFINLGALGVALKFDKFPFGLLTMIVSLEAIFLSTFVMITQNRQAARADVRSEVDFENNVRSEIWTVHIGQALGIDTDHVERMIKDAMAGYRKEGAAV
jgi:uncharacterized membrane protein